MAISEALTKRLEKIPIFQTLHLQVDAADGGQAILTAPYDAAYDGVFESFHGGLLMTVADTAACVAVLTMVGADAAITTTDMNIHFLAPCRSSATADARVIKCGRTLCPVSVEIRDQKGAVAVAQVTYMRLADR